MKRVIAACLMVGAMLFCMCGVAHAEEPYTCEGGGNPVPATVSGSVLITESGNCVINHHLTASGSISIYASGSIEAEGIATSGPYDIFLSGTNVETGAIASGEGFGVDANGNVEVEGELSTNTYGVGGNILIQAEGEVATGSINTNGASASGVVEIQAEQNGDNNLFTIGGSGHTNGVNGSITTSSTTAGETNPEYVEKGWVTITNGSSASTGGITLESMADIDVVNSASRSGAIILNAQNGVLTLPSGHMSVDGSSGEMAGFIELLAKEVTVPDGAELTANQESSAAASCHAVVIAASKVSYGGTGLEIQSNGNGYETNCGSGVAFVPQGAVAFGFLENELNNIYGSNKYVKTSNTLSVSGTGPLTITANGSKDEVDIWGKELELGSTYGSTTSILSYGSGDSVYIRSGEFDGTTLSKLELLAPTEVYVTEEQTGATPGKVTVIAKEIAKPSYHVALVADGIEGADGGTVEVSTTEGEVYIGSTSGSIELNASAYEGTGNAGTVKVKAGTGKVKVVEGESVYASSFEGNSSGGLIEISGGAIENVGGSNTGFYATGSGSGKGGTITLKSESKLSIGGGTSDFFLSTVYESTGGGGTVNLSGSEVNINGGYIYVSAYPSGNGGNINVSETKTLNVSDEYELTANGAGNGNGGEILLEADEINFESTGSAISANGEGTGNGGKISLHATDGMLDMNSSADDGVSLTADAGSTGNGGEVTMAAPEVKVDGAYVSVSAAKGNGGTITVSETGELKVSNEAELKADGGENGNGGGGEISLTAESIELEEATIEANGSGTGHGGEIKLDSEAGIIISGILEANADPSGDGDGGLVDIESKDEINVEEEKIYAEGSDEGEGGIVEIGDVSNFSVDELIGDSEGIMALPIVAAGEITLNHDPCKKYQNPEGTSEWPKKYWDCANPTSPTALDEVLVKAVTKYLKPALRKSSGSSKIELYIFAKQSEWETYFKRTLPEPVSGITWQASNGGTIYVSVFEEKAGGGLREPTALSEISIHETGHGFDHLFKQVNESASSRYATWLQADLTHLNEVPPCTKSGAKEPPFAHVENTDDEDICIGTSLNSKYTGKTNSEILLQADVGKYWFEGKLNDGGEFGYSELFAQSLAFQAFVSGLPDREEYTYNVPDNVFENGYFPCVLEWVKSLQEGKKEPSTNTSCGD